LTTVSHVDREHLHLAEQGVDVGLIDVGGEVTAPQRGIHCLRFCLQYLGHNLGVVGLEKFGPGIADNFDIRRELFEVVNKLSRRIAAIGIIRRARRPFLQSLRLGDRRGITAADD
jgi:hypothetical protein